jgi:hypothetical protein
MSSMQLFLEYLRTPAARCPFQSLSGWKALLAGEEVGGDIETLQDALAQSIQQYPPKGHSLGMLRRTLKFTVDGEGIPYRPEEALERFICANNSDCRNQIPVGGKKESADLALVASDGVIRTLLELKSWDGSDTPLFAVAEIMKNIQKLELCPAEVLSESTNCAVLAPTAYYRRFFAQATPEGIGRFKSIVRGLASAFGRNIDLLALDVEWDGFRAACMSLSRTGSRPNRWHVRPGNFTMSLPSLLSDTWEPYPGIVERA